MVKLGRSATADLPSCFQCDEETCSLTPDITSQAMNTPSKLMQNTVNVIHDRNGRVDGGQCAGHVCEWRSRLARTVLVGFVEYRIRTERPWR